MPEEAARVASIKTGVIELTDISMDAAPELEAAGFKTFVADYQTPMVMIHGAYDRRAAGMPVTDIRVRKAMAISIDREEIMKNFFYGKAGAAMPAFFQDTTPEILLLDWTPLHACVSSKRGLPEELKLGDEATF